MHPATKIICKGLPSTKGAKKLDGRIPRIILNNSAKSKDVSPSEEILKNGSIATAPMMLTTKDIDKKRFIIRLPILPKVAVSPIL